MLFVDYPKASDALIDEASHQDALVLAHREEVLKALVLAASRQDHRVTAKYVWAMEYHNDYCKSIGRDDLSIKWPSAIKRSETGDN